MFGKWAEGAKTSVVPGAGRRAGSRGGRARGAANDSGDALAVGRAAGAAGAASSTPAAGALPHPPRCADGALVSPDRTCNTCSLSAGRRRRAHAHVFSSLV